MPNINISSIGTIKHSTWTDDLLFNPFGTELVLAVNFDLSADILVNTPAYLRITFEIIELRSNDVVYYHVWNKIAVNPNPSWTHLFAILGPLNPHNIGLVWVQGNIFGFRASVEGSYTQNSRLTAIDALAVSEIKWFRVEDYFLL